MGVKTVLEKVQIPTMQEMQDFKATPDTLIDNGDGVVALGEYTGVSTATGRPLRARFAHVWRIVDGKVASFESISDTGMYRDAIS